MCPGECTSQLAPPPRRGRHANLSIWLHHRTTWQAGYSHSRNHRNVQRLENGADIAIVTGSMASVSQGKETPLRQRCVGPGSSVRWPKREMTDHGGRIDEHVGSTNSMTFKRCLLKNVVIIREFHVLLICCTKNYGNTSYHALIY